MSDHDTAPDPTDKAYVQAEAVLDDENARAARRARVLAAVAAEPAPVVPEHSRQRLSWARGGWLMAASVAGVSALLALQVDRSGVIPPPPPTPAAQAVPATVAPAPERSPPPAARASAPAAKSAPDALAATPLVPTPSAPEAAFASPPPPAAPAPAAAPAPPPRARADSASEVVVTAQRQAPSTELRESSRGLAAAQGERLRAAAAAGQLADMTSLLDQGAPIDATDDEGETALMKSVQANRPDAAALLLRRGASLERRSRAGESAREMAAAVDDAELDRALGLGP